MKIFLVLHLLLSGTYSLNTVLVKFADIEECRLTRDEWLESNPHLRTLDIRCMTSEMYYALPPCGAIGCYGAVR
jgi:hypothetical protein